MSSLKWKSWGGKSIQKTERKNQKESKSQWIGFVDSEIWEALAGSPKHSR